jgi:molybdenum cofactor cytidylyltransferase
MPAVSIVSRSREPIEIFPGRRGQRTQCYNRSMGMGNGISLAKALRVERGAVVSFVGGGGKTTSMFRLAAELSAAGLRVVSTTTTHISKEQVLLAPVSISLEELALLGSHLDSHGHCLIIGPPDGKGRVFGASSELIASLSARIDVDVVLVEADGSRSLPFKAPGRHEPVVPDATTILAPIAGLNSIGQPLDEDHVHRSELAAALAQQPVGSPITPQTLGRVLSHPEGGAKNCPAGARLVPILNKADTSAAARQAGEAAEIMLADSIVDTVMVTTMRQDPPVREAWTHAAGIFLAAGISSRPEGTEEGVPRKGATMASHSARTALDSGLDPVIVVLGNQADKVEKSLAGLPVRLVYNPDFEAGQSTSIRKGLEVLPSYAGAAIFFASGQLPVTGDVIRKMVCAHRQSFAPVCISVFDGQYAYPMLFDRTVFRELASLRGDADGWELLKKYAGSVVPVPADVDTPDDYERQNTEF